MQCMSIFDLEENQNTKDLDTSITYDTELLDECLLIWSSISAKNMFKCQCICFKVCLICLCLCNVYVHMVLQGIYL